MIKKEELEKIIEDTFFHKEENNTIMLATGRGGMKEFLKGSCEAWGLEYTWRNMRRMYYLAISEGYILKIGNCYQLGL